MGKPSEEDIEFIKDEELKEYLRSFPDWKPIDWNRKFPYLKGDDSNLGIDLLKRCLEFNPSKRISVIDALNHPYLKKFKDANKEILFKGIFNANYEDWRYRSDIKDDELAEYFMGYVMREENVDIV